ncbi:hypothetical protein C2E23DRAFT_860450 [Lenzites betulinus]|nr:hypothetical protein C2E23DRAFT_860450 [Lenzites betulinus]
MNLPAHLSFVLLLSVALVSASYLAIAAATAQEGVVGNACTRPRYVEAVIASYDDLISSPLLTFSLLIYTPAPGEAQHYLHDYDLHDLYGIPNDIFLPSPLPTDGLVCQPPAAPITPLVPRRNRPPRPASSAVISVPLDGDDRSSPLAAILRACSLWELVSLVSAVAWLFVCLIA